MEEIIKLSPVKDPKGTYFENKYDDRDGLFLKQIRISYSSYYITFPQFVAAYPETSKLFPSEKYGSVEGSNFAVIDLGCDEHIIAVSGSHISYGSRKRLKMLTLVTNLRTYGPFGRTRPFEHSYSYGPEEEFNYVMGRNFAGFHGTVHDDTIDDGIESLGVFIKLAWSE